MGLWQYIEIYWSFLEHEEYFVVVAGFWWIKREFLGIFFFEHSSSFVKIQSFEVSLRWREMNLKLDFYDLGDLFVARWVGFLLEVSNSQKFLANLVLANGYLLDICNFMKFGEKFSKLFLLRCLIIICKVLVFTMFVPSEIVSLINIKLIIQIFQNSK